MKRFISLFIVALFIVPLAMAGDPSYRIPITITATNMTYVVGRYEKPCITRIEAVGQLPATVTNTVFVTYGDLIGGTRILCGLTNVSGAASWTFSQPYPDLEYGDILSLGGLNGATSGYYRVHCINRDTRPLN